MSPQDSTLLQDFLNQLVQVRGVPKDPEADAMIARAVAQQPEAAYLLVQRALLQQQALDQAQAEIAALRQQLRGGAPTTPEFLDPNAWGHRGGQRSATSAVGGAPAPQGASRAYPQAYPQSSPRAWQPGSAARGGMGSALGTIASTAAGVAAGAFLFQGLGHLFGGNHDGNGFLGNDDAFSSLTAPLEDLSGDRPGASESPGIADSGVSEHDFSGDGGADGFGDDAFGGGDEGMLG